MIARMGLTAFGLVIAFLGFIYGGIYYLIVPKFAQYVGPHIHLSGFHATGFVGFIFRILTSGWPLMVGFVLAGLVFLYAGIVMNRKIRPHAIPQQ